MSFDAALRLTLGFEGGTSNDPNDRGGLTRFGITQGTYSRWRAHQGLFSQKVTKISDEEVRAIYRHWYWNAAHCDELPPILAQCVFDAAVNHGAVRAIRLLQKALHLPDDGVFGPQTREAAKEADEHDTVSRYLDAREDFYAEIIEHDPSQVTFEHGWSNRVDLLRQTLLAELA